MSASPPADAFLAELDGLAAAVAEPDRLGAAIGAGSAPRAIAKRAACEAYHLARWTTPELALLVANAPDVYAFTMDHAPHYGHWARDLARRTGYLQDGSAPVTLAVCRALEVGDDALRAHEPLAESVAAAFTLLYYVRRSYDEGLAAVACAWNPGSEGLVAGLRAHYGAPSDRPSSAEGGPSARGLFRRLPLTEPGRARCREAVRNVALVRATRVRAMNGWLAA